MTHTELVQRAARWLRNSARVPYEGFPGKTLRAACGVVLTEYVSGIEIPDAIGWAWCGRTSILVECKASRSDFLRDRKKSFRREHGSRFALGMYRYYLTNPGIAQVDELPAGWGLLEVAGRRVTVMALAARQDRDAGRELSLLWSECRKIQIVKRGGQLRDTKQVRRILESVGRAPDL